VPLSYEITVEIDTVVAVSAGGAVPLSYTVVKAVGTTVCAGGGVPLS